ncbi:MAG: hypothetical protein V1918_03080 [Planctomycetota bacterium]
MSDIAGREPPSPGQIFQTLRALGLAEKYQGDPEKLAQWQGDFRRAFDQSYVEHPKMPWGYFKEGNAPSLGTAASGLSALLSLDLQPTLGAEARKMAAFLEGRRDLFGRYEPGLSPDRPALLREEEDRETGLAQLALVEWYIATGEARLLPGLLKGFAHVQRRVQAPEYDFPLPLMAWHLEACAHLYRATRQEDIARFVFRFSDLIASSQDRKEETPEDCRGRFEIPLPEGGNAPPAAEATGLYLQGLIQGLALAREVGDERRLDRYREAVQWGLRALLQLQIRERYDTWCMPCPERAVGGFRAREDAALVRIEGQACAIAALDQALAVLEEADYASTGQKANE